MYRKYNVNVLKETNLIASIYSVGGGAKTAAATLYGQKYLATHVKYYI